MLIGIDIDGTLYQWTVAANDALIEKFGIDDPGEHATWNHLYDRLTPEQWAWLWSDLAAESVFGREDLIWPGSRGVVNALALKYEVHFVTHRNPHNLAGVTGDWLATHFVDYRGVHVVDSEVEKHTIADWDVFIDDKIETVEAFASALPNCLTLMPFRPWNEGCASGVGFTEWWEVLDLVAAREFRRAA